MDFITPSVVNCRSFKTQSIRNITPNKFYSNVLLINTVTYTPIEHRSNHTLDEAYIRHVVGGAPHVNEEEIW